MTAVDVFIPCYNYGRYLEGCVASALAQEGVEVRVLIIDDASTDDSLAEAHRVAGLDRRVTVMPHPVNKGHIATYNDGIAWASAPYMTLVSADDLLAPMALSRAVAAMEAHPHIGFVFGSLAEFNEAEITAVDAAAHARERPAGYTVRDGEAFIAEFCRHPHNLVAASGVVIRTELQQRLGGYRPELPHSGDLEMWLRLAAHSDVGILEAPTALTRIHATNMRNAYHADRMIGDYRQRALALRMFSDGHAARLPAVKALTLQARRTLAAELLDASDRCFDGREEGAAAKLAALAREIDGSLLSTVPWWRMVAKRTLGWRACQAISSTRGAMRGSNGVMRNASNHGRSSVVQQFRAWMTSRQADGRLTMTTGSEPGTHKPMAFLFCCDPGYFQHLAVALTSLLTNNRRHMLDVTIVTSSRDAEAERRLRGSLSAFPATTIRLLHYPLERHRDLPTSEHITAETYLRILALDLLPLDCEKVIYLDSDLVVLGDLGELWETDLSGRPLAAVPDPYGADRPAALGMPAGATYVNAGVLLLNVRHWREQEIAARVIDYATRSGSALVYHDQDAINALLHAETLVLPYRWNFQARMLRDPDLIPDDARESIAAAARDPAILHYTTSKKPWIFTAFMPRRAVYHHYLRKTAWRGTPTTDRSLAKLPEALFNYAAYIIGFRCTYERFLSSTTAGRVLVRAARALSMAAAAVGLRTTTRAMTPATPNAVASPNHVLGRQQQAVGEQRAAVARRNDLSRPLTAAFWRNPTGPAADPQSGNAEDCTQEPLHRPTGQARPATATVTGYDAGLTAHRAAPVDGSRQA